MKTNNTETEELKPLPRLPVRRSEYCDQVTTDLAVDYLVSNFSARILRWVAEERSKEGGAEGGFSAQDFAHFLRRAINVTKELEQPATFIGRFDVIYELRRRMCRVYSVALVSEAQGKPLASAIDGTYPELITQDIEIINFTGYERQDIENILQSAYRLQPDLFFVLAEEIRNDLYLGDAYDALMDVFSHLNGKEDTQFARDLVSEVRLRLYRMCDVKHWSDAK